MTETDESAAAALFVQLCRECRALRHWLWEDFARDAATRERFARLLRGRASIAVARIADLGDDTSGADDEIRKLRASFPTRIFGGLSWAEVEALIGQFRAGRSDLVAFLLALQWRRAGDAATNSAHLLQSAAEFLDPVFRTGDRHRLNQLCTAVTLVEGNISPKHRRTSVGPANWWKLQLLFYILRHPKPSYATRELIAHLKQEGLRVAAKDIRRFCARHGIRRDMRAGRPRAARTAMSANARTLDAKLRGRNGRPHPHQNFTAPDTQQPDLTGGKVESAADLVPR
jgi:hypothetical protein